MFFDFCDEDNSGFLERQELSHVAAAMGNLCTEEELDQMMSMKELETKALIEHMKGNYTTDHVNLAKDYQNIEENNYISFGK